jgi:hypothetical protein
VETKQKSILSVGGAAGQGQKSVSVFEDGELRPAGNYPGAKFTGAQKNKASMDEVLELNRSLLQKLNEVLEINRGIEEENILLKNKLSVF